MKWLLPIYVRIQTKLQSEEGATMVEYALVLTLIAVAAATATALLGTNVTAMFTKIAGKLQ